MNFDRFEYSNKINLFNLFDQALKLNVGCPGKFTQILRVFDKLMFNIFHKFTQDGVLHFV